MGKGIPDRWRNYQPIGKRISGTRFIAFKVPLHENINENVDKQLRLAPYSLLETVPNLGLIVDLTNTNRYYDPRVFEAENVRHQKLCIPGHLTPPNELAERFCQYVNNFLEANADNDKLIGVHCTHGVNRTGYLICYYMILNMNMSPALAIKTFAEARGHQIERENYTDALQQLQKSKLRDHSHYQHRSDDHDESSSHIHSHNHRQSVYHRTPAEQTKIYQRSRDQSQRNSLRPSSYRSRWQQQRGHLDPYDKRRGVFNDYRAATSHASRYQEQQSKLSWRYQTQEQQSYSSRGSRDYSRDYSRDNNYSSRNYNNYSRDNNNYSRNYNNYSRDNNNYSRDINNYNNRDNNSGRNRYHWSSNRDQA